MLTYEDCLEMSGSTQDVVDAVAEHEHLCALQAVAQSAYLLQLSGGGHRLRRIIVDDIRKAQSRGDRAHERALRALLSRVMREQPQLRRVA